MDLTGRTAGTYRIQDKLGEGGMGAVYRGVDTMVERTVAVKVLKPEIAGNPEIVERFRTEAVTLARLNHPSIATLYTFFREGSDYFMVMEFVSGSTLEDAIRRSGALPWRQATDVMIHILEALQHAHQYGVLHRDIKPANIMLPQTGGVKVTDFGIAQVLGAARLTREGRMVGTLEYLAPERIVGKPFDERSDLYSAGVVFYEMLSGHLPFEADTDYALIRAHTEAPPPPLENFGVNIPRALVEVLWRSLAKLPEHRYPSAASMAAALRDAKTRAELEAPLPPVNTIRETRLAGGSPYTPAPTASMPQPMPYIPPATPVAPAVTLATGNARAMWAVGAIAAVVLLAGVGLLAMKFLSPTPPPKPVAVDPGPGSTPVPKPREPIIPVGPAVEISDGGQPSPTPSHPVVPAPGPGRNPAPAPPLRSGRPAIGVRGVYVAGPLARTLQLPDGGGLLIEEVLRGSGAEAAGVRGPSSVTSVAGTSIGIGGDLVIAIDGQPLQSQDAPARVLADKRPGDVVTLTIFRAGRSMNVPMKLSDGVDVVLTQNLPPPQQPQPPPQQPEPQPPPRPVTPPPYNPAPVPPSNPTPAVNTGQRIEVIHDHGGIPANTQWFACRGYLQTVGNDLVYTVLGTNDGRNDSFRVPLTEITELKVNVLPIRNLQAFHIKMNGKNFNFVPTQFSTVQAVSEIQRARR